MTTEQLIAELQKHPGREVFVHWETIFAATTPTHVFLAGDGSVIIDADDNRYKEALMESVDFGPVNNGVMRNDR